MSHDGSMQESREFFFPWSATYILFLKGQFFANFDHVSRGFGLESSNNQ
jgi:hypothetical protein